MRKIIMIVGILAVLAGGGAGGYFFFLQKPAEASLPADEHASVEEKPADDHAAKGKDEHGKDDGHGGGAGPTFVRLDPLVVPIMDNDGISQTISMMIVFEVADEEAGKKLESLKPRMKDAMIQNMYGMLNQKAAMENGALRVGYVKERLNAVAQKVMGEGVVTDVLLQMVQQNPI